MCIDNSLNGALVRGKIVLCDGYYPSERVGFASGAAGVIFSSTLPLVAADVFALPAMHISANDGQSVYNYLKSTRYKIFYQHIKIIHKCYKILLN